MRAWAGVLLPGVAGPDAVAFAPASVAGWEEHSAVPLPEAAASALEAGAIETEVVAPGVEAVAVLAPFAGRRLEPAASAQEATSLGSEVVRPVAVMVGVLEERCAVGLLEPEEFAPEAAAQLASGAAAFHALSAVRGQEAEVSAPGECSLAQESVAVREAHSVVGLLEAEASGPEEASPATEVVAVRQPLSADQGRLADPLYSVERRPVAQRQPPVERVSHGPYPPREPERLVPAHLGAFPGRRLPEEGVPDSELAPAAAGQKEQEREEARCAPRRAGSSRWPAAVRPGTQYPPSHRARLPVVERSRER